MLVKALKITLLLVLCVLFTNLFDLIYSLIFTKNGYVFEVRTDLIVPLCTGLTIGVVLFGRDKK